MGVDLAAEAESRWRVNAFESVHGTELWVKWTCAVGCVQLKRSLLGQISLCNATNNHQPQHWQLLRDSPLTEKKTLLECLIYSAAIFAPKHFLFVSTAISVFLYLEAPSFYNNKTFCDNYSHTYMYLLVYICMFFLMPLLSGLHMHIEMCCFDFSQHCYKRDEQCPLQWVGHSPILNLLSYIPSCHIKLYIKDQ